MNAKEREVLDERYEQMVRLHADMMHAVNDSGERICQRVYRESGKVKNYLFGIFMLMIVLVILIWRM